MILAHLLLHIGFHVSLNLQLLVLEAHIVLDLKYLDVFGFDIGRAKGTLGFVTFMHDKLALN